MARGKQHAEKHVDWDLVWQALAKAVADGDPVNLRLVFAPSSPARAASPEVLESDKYAYLRPSAEQVQTQAFQDALELVRRPAIQDHVRGELAAARPAQLPSELVLALGDCAVRAGKYAAAAQAYELLRLRRRMQAEFLAQGDAALDGGAIAKAVQAYLIGTGLAYDYAAFPEPLPAVRDYQRTALTLHADPANCVAVQDPSVHALKALDFLLATDTAAERFRERPLEQTLAFLVELVDRLDPEWTAFKARYREAIEMWRQCIQQWRTAEARYAGGDMAAAEQMEDAAMAQARRIPAHLLDRVIEGGDWWQYLKELAYKHPASVLFVGRQPLGEVEILVPRFRPSSPVIGAFALVEGGGQGAPELSDEAGGPSPGELA